MATSSLAAIYAALASKVITVDGKTPKVRGINEPVGALSGAMLPLRILHPFGNATEAQSFAYRGTSNLARPTWRIVDFLAWQPVGVGVPPTGALVRYMAAYAEMLTGFKPAPGVNWVLQDARMTPAVYPWPIDGDQWFYGVQVELVIMEVISP